MASEKGESRENVVNDWMRRFMMLFFIGFFIIFVGIIITVIAVLLFGEGAKSFGGFIFIWPIPIVFGAGPAATWLVLFAIILGILSVILFLVFWRKRS
ncbi:MAG: DUF131 domain-containing protein [Candidatus Bathyarchaeia archaeon]